MYLYSYTVFEGVLLVGTLATGALRCISFVSPQLRPIALKRGQHHTPCCAAMRGKVVNRWMAARVGAESPRCC